MKKNYSNNKNIKSNIPECDIVSDGNGRFFCKHCGHEYVALSAAMLYMVVYGAFRDAYAENDGLVAYEPFVQRLRKGMDEEQIGRTFRYLKHLGLVSKSADGKYLKDGVGQEAEDEHIKVLRREVDVRASKIDARQ